MNRKWYISTFIIILTVLVGVASQQQISIPNQEIVLQFTTESITAAETDDAIAVVKKQLQSLGIVNIYVGENSKEGLKITYYSEIKAAKIKKALSSNKGLDFECDSDDQHKVPFQSTSSENTSGYNLDVFEILDGTNTALDLGGKFALEQKSVNNLILNPNSPISPIHIEICEIDPNENIVYISQNNIALTIDNTSHKIPEVRAGPVLMG